VDENHDIIYKENSSSMKPMKLGIQKGVDHILRERESTTLELGGCTRIFKALKYFPN
jgi:hypothetical protein